MKVEELLLAPRSVRVLILLKVAKSLPQPIATLDQMLDRNYLRRKYGKAWGK